MRLDPLSAHALHTLAVCQLALRRRTAAEASAQAALEANPHSSIAELTAGLVAEARRDWDRAEHDYREGLRVEPQHTDLALRLGKLLHRRGRREEAMEAYLAAARSSPTDARARHGLGRLGLPVLGGGLALLIKLVLLDGALRVIENSPSPTRIALVIGVLLAGRGRRPPGGGVLRLRDHRIALSAPLLDRPAPRHRGLRRAAGRAFACLRRA